MAKETKKEEIADAPQTALREAMKNNHHFNDIEANTYTVSTGSLGFDLETDGGIKNSIIRVAGMAETGKTSFALNVTRIFLLGKNRRAIYFLSDKDLSPNLMVRSGVKFVDNLDDWKDGTCYIIRTNVYETVCNTIKELIEKGDGKYHNDKQYMFILDSMDNFAPKSALEGSFGDSSSKGGTGAITSHFFQCFNILLPLLGHFTIMISQFRDTINMGKGAPIIKQMSTSGGRSQEHAASWAFEFAPAMNSQEDMFWEGVPYKSKKIGHNCIIRIKKSTNEKTGTTVKYPVIYGRENGNSIWIEREIFSALLLWRKVVAKSSWLQVAPATLAEIRKIDPEFPEQIQGEEKFVKALEERPKVTEYLYKNFRDSLTSASE